MKGHERDDLLAGQTTVNSTVVIRDRVDLTRTITAALQNEKGT